MKLSLDARQSLYELTICTCRPTPETPELVRHGLATRGKGRLGEYVRITEKGRMLIAKESDAERLERNHAYHVRITAESLKRTPGGDARAGTGRPVPAVPQGDKPTPRRRGHTGELRPQQPSSAPHDAVERGAPSSSGRGGLPTSPPARKQSRPAAARRETSTAALTPSAAPGTSSKAGRHSKSPNAALPRGRAAHGPAPSSISPNAVRVTIGNKHFYYPLSTKDTVRNGKVELVVTRNRAFSTATVGSSKANADVLCE